MYRTPAGSALVWYAVWDEVRLADRFAARITGPFVDRARPGYRAAVERLDVAGRPAVRLVAAPIRWEGWTSPPAADVSR